MCRAKSDPGYYRCEWKAWSHRRLFRTLADSALDLEAISVVDVVDPSIRGDIDQMLRDWRNVLAETVGELSASDVDQLRADMLPGRRKVGKGHVLCAIAAAIGEACAGAGGITGNVAVTVGDRVEAQTGSRIAGKVAKVAASRFLSTLTATTPLGQVEHLGMLADMAAVSLCPAQQPGEHPHEHPEVVESEQRAKRALTVKAVRELLGT